MRLEFNKTGAERKALVTAMGEILNVKPRYMKMPTMDYEVDYFTVTKDGAVEFDDRTDSEEIENLLEALAERGFIAGQRAGEDAEKRTGLTIEVPLDKVSVGNLTKLLEAKGGLIQKALGVVATPVEIGEDKVSFPWFKDAPGADEAKAYTHLISALCRMSRDRKRVTAREKNVNNEKYAFRCFLLRLGFIGEEYKGERKILLRNLSGSSAFKSGNPKVKEYMERVENDAGLYDDVMSLQDKEANGNEVPE